MCPTQTRPLIIMQAALSREYLEVNMNYTSVRNPQWSRDGSMIDCVVEFDEIGEVVFSASPNDSVAHGREIYARCVAGDFGPVAEYVPQPGDFECEPDLLPPEQQLPVTDTGFGEVR